MEMTGNNDARESFVLKIKKTSDSDEQDKCDANYVVSFICTFHWEAVPLSEMKSTEQRQPFKEI